MTMESTVEGEVKMELTSDLEFWSENFGRCVYEVLENKSTAIDPIREMLNTLAADKIASSFYKPKTIGKNLKIASDCLEKGNEYYSKLDNDNITLAFEEYTKCILNAPKKSNELSVAYGNRSVLLCDAKLYSDCLSDINEAIKNGYPDELKSKLYFRKAICLQALCGSNDHPDVVKAFLNVRKFMEKIKPDERIIFEIIVNEQEKLNLDIISMFPKWDYDKFIPSLEMENSSIPGLSDSIKLKYSKEFGRHFVASRDIKPGEVLAIVKPYVKMNFPDVKLKFCCHCQRQTWSSIPCDYCNEVLFCSDACRKKANDEYHYFECPVLLSMREFDLNDEQFIFARLVAKAIQEAGGCVDNLMSDIEKIDKETDPLKKGLVNNKFDTKKFSSVYSLSYHPPENGLEVSVHAYSILIAYLFATRTTFFGEKLDDDLASLKNNEKFILLIKLIRRLMLISAVNSSSAMILGKDYETEKLLHGIYPGISFFNHSCYSTIASSLQGDTIIMTTAHSIKKGEQIFYNYGPNYKNESREMRRQELSQIYRFDCKCMACEKNWPMNFGRLSSFSSVSNDRNYTAVIYKLLEINDKFTRATNHIVNFGTKYKKVPDVSESINEITTLIEKCSKCYGKYSKETLFIVSKLERFLFNWNSPNVSLTL